MIEMATVLLASGLLIIIAYEFSCMIKKREWGENTKSFF